MPRKTLKQIFPELGLIEIPLHQESANVFEALERVTNSGTKNLDQIEQLGELKNVLHCGHHSRYEYLVFQLYLIHLLKQKAGVIGLSTSLEFSNGKTVSSGEELLKCWVLLTENGHIRGTYEIERFWLHTISREPGYLDYLLELVGDQDLQPVARKIIESESLHSFYRILAWIFLTRAARTVQPEHRPSLDLGKTYLKALLIRGEDGSKLARCQQYFERIRRLAVLYLDLSRLPIHVKFNPAIVLQDMQARPDYYLEGSEEHFQRLLDSLHELLIERVYASPEAVRYKLERFHGLKQHVATKERQRGNKLIASAREMESSLQAAKNDALVRFNGSLDHLSHYARIHLRPAPFILHPPAKVFHEEETLNRHFGSMRWRPFVTGFSTKNGPAQIIDVFEDGRAPEDREAYVVSGLISSVARWFKGFEDPAALLASDEQLLRIFTACMSRAIRKGLRIRFLSQLHAKAQADVFFHRHERSQWSRELAWVSRRQPGNHAKAWEGECLRREIRAAPRGTILAVNRNVAIEDSQNKRVAELDGVFLRILRGTLEINIVEAKSGHTGGTTQAVRQLTGTLQKLGATAEEAASMITAKPRSAIAVMPFSVGRDWQRTRPVWTAGIV